METRKRHTNSKTKQRHEHRHIIQTHLTSLSDGKNTGKDSHTSQTISHISPHNMSSKVTTLQAQHYITSTTGFNQNKQLKRTITVALNMSKAFDTVNIHTLTHKLHQTNILHAILKFIVNYIKG